MQRARTLFKKAKVLLLQDRPSEAIRSLEQSLKLDPDSPQSYEAWLTLGKLRLGNPAWSTRAIEALQAASRIHVRATEPWTLMGELYLRKGFRANAVGCYRKALELDSNVAVPIELNLNAEDGEDPEDLDGMEDPSLMGRLGSGLRAMLGRNEKPGGTGG